MQQIKVSLWLNQLKSNLEACHFYMKQSTCDQSDAAGNNRSTRKKKWESEKRRVGQMETLKQRKRAREGGIDSFFPLLMSGACFHPVAVEICPHSLGVKTSHTSVHLPSSVSCLWILIPCWDWFVFILQVSMLLLYNRFLSLLESIYRRGARRWRKLYRVNGHLFQAKRFNRVS